MAITILDKSAFQSLSKKEHYYFNRYFFHNITPILTNEIIIDLSKTFKKGDISQNKVQELASKIIGSGNPVNANYKNLCIGSLLGYHIEISTGQAAIDQWTKVPLDNGNYGIWIDTSPSNKAILRWSDGNFTEFEELLAQLLRDTINEYDIDVFRDQLDSLQIILPRVNSIDEITPVVDDFLMRSSLQEVWLRLIFSIVKPDQRLIDPIMSRWHHESTHLKYFSPYANFCVRVFLTLQIATRSKIIKWKPSNVLDMQYLFYLPFCMLFVSGDKLHIQLAPLLIRENQSFITRDNFKKSLKMQIEHWDSLNEKEKKLLRFALGIHPYPLKGSIVPVLWKKHCIPWDRSRISYRKDISKEYRKEILDHIESLI